MALKLPSYVPPTQQAKRPSATRVNRSQPKEQNLTVAGYNEVVPIVYGEDRVSGPILAGPVSKNGWAYWAIAISHGPIESFDQVAIGSQRFNVTAPAHEFTGDKFKYQLAFYDGTQNSVDPALAEGIDFFGDTFEGVAYVSVKAQGENMSISNSLSFRIKGRKVLDPRDNIIRYTQNPALHLADFVENDYFGVGRKLIGVEALADHCDSLFGGAPLCRTNAVIQSSMTESDVIDYLASHAEALWGYKGEDVYVVPDGAVSEESVIDLFAHEIVDETVNLFTEGAENIPSSVTFSFNSDEEDGLAGAPVFVTREENATASTPYINSAITMMGVFRRSEAQRRAEQRLARLQIPGKVSFQMFDTGSRLSVGDVVRFPDSHGIGDMELRVMAIPDMIAPGFYQIHCEVYSAAVYEETEVGAVLLPKGAVVPWLGGAQIPSNMSRLDIPEDLLIRGGGLDAVVQVVESTPDSFNGSMVIDPSGDHGATQTTFSMRRQGFGEPSRGPVSYISSSSPVPRSGNHNHGGVFGFSVSESDMPRFPKNTVRSPFLVCNEETYVVRGVGFFHKNKVLSPSYYWQDVQGGIVAKKTGDAQKVSVMWSKAYNTPMDGSHSHGNSSGTLQSGSRGAGGSAPHGGATGSHSHRILLEADLELIAERMELVATTVNGASIPSGGVVGYLGSTIPDGWRLCDGSNGTIDLLDKFIYVGQDGQNTNKAMFNASSTSQDGSHSHIRSSSSMVGDLSASAYPANHPASDGLHSHDINYSKTIDFIPKHIKLAFIQYIGE